MNRPQQQEGLCPWQIRKTLSEIEPMAFQLTFSQSDVHFFWLDSYLSLTKCNIFWRLLSPCDIVYIVCQLPWVRRNLLPPSYRQWRHRISLYTKIHKSHSNLSFGIFFHNFITGNSNAMWPNDSNSGRSSVRVRQVVSCNVFCMMQYVVYCLWSGAILYISSCRIKSTANI